MKKESFDPIAEFNNLSTDTSNRRKHFREFIKNREAQREEIANLSAKIISEIIADPDMEKENLLELVRNHYEEPGLSEGQEKIISDILDEYFRRHEEIIVYKEKIEDGEISESQVFKRFFRFEPQEVKIIFRSMTLHFIVNGDDYSRIHRDHGVIASSVGYFDENRPLITVENGEKSKNADTMMHEEFHALFDLFDSRILKYFSEKRSQENLHRIMEKINFANTLEDKEIILYQLIRRMIHASSKELKDELFAYIRDGEFKDDEIVDILSGSSEDAGNYDSSASDIKRLKKFLKQKITDANTLNSLLRSVDEMRELETRKLVEEGIAILRAYLADGGTLEKVFSYFMPIPLEKWKSEYRRRKRFQKEKHAY